MKTELGFEVVGERPVRGVATSNPAVAGPQSGGNAPASAPAPLAAAPWRWGVVPGLLARAFAAIPETPVPVWAGKHVFLDRRVTTRPGYYDVEETPWTYEFQDIFRTRRNPWTGEAVRKVTWLKSSVTGCTEGALNGVRWIAQHDPQNVIFAIDSAKEAGTISEVRLQPTLRQLDADIFTGDGDDVSKFLLTLRRMLIYFLGSYSPAGFANKMAEVVIVDEVEHHGHPESVEDAESRLKSALRPLLVLMSKPEFVGGRIDTHHKGGTCHVYEVPCPHCTEKAGELSGYQELVVDNLKFDHWKDAVTGEWDFSEKTAEPYFSCVHCGGKILEEMKRWMNQRDRRRWRQTNMNPEPGHISFHISDWVSYHPDAQWRKLAVKYIRSKGDPVRRKAFRNHHEGLPYEIRATKTEAEDIVLLAGEHARGELPWKPRALMLGADVGLHYVKWVVLAFRENGDAAVIDYGEERGPADLLTVMREKRYSRRDENGEVKRHRIALGFVDAKYHKEDVNKACFRSDPQYPLRPAAGITSEQGAASISMSRVDGFPRWFRSLVFVDRDAKSDLYEFRITEWVDWERYGKHKPADQRRAPEVPRFTFFRGIGPRDPFVIEFTNERLVELTAKDTEWLPHASKQFVWKRKGANHWGDASKICLVAWRWHTRPEADAD